MTAKERLEQKARKSGWKIVEPGAGKNPFVFAVSEYEDGKMVWFRMSVCDDHEAWFERFPEEKSQKDK